MASPRAYSGRQRERDSRAGRRRRGRTWKIAVPTLVAAAAVVIVLAALNAPPPSFQASLPDDSALLTGRPSLLDIAHQGDLAIQLPVAQQSVTALGYHGGAAAALPLDPVGRQANEGIFTRIFRRLTGNTPSGVTYYLLEGGSGSPTSALDVGAPAGTVAYAPVSGTVISIRDIVLDGRPRGQRIDIVPSESPSVVVSITRLRADPSLTVGSPVQKQTSKIGVVVDLSRIEKQALAAVSGDRGNHLSIEVRPTATLAYG